MSAPTPIITHAPPLLWAAARALITTIFALFGDPAHIAWQHTHRQSERALLLKWLRAGEALMRHLLLIEAAHYAKPNTRPLLREPRTRVRRLVTFEADKPEAWRVSFRCFSSPARGGSVSAQRAMAMGAQQAQLSNDGARVAPSVARGDTSPVTGGGKHGRLSREERWCSEYWPKPKFYSAWPLALRAEAMLRAFNNPEAYAKRLARRLHATPHRAAQMTRYPPNLPHVIDDFDILSEHARTARRRFESG